MLPDSSKSVKFECFVFFLFNPDIETKRFFLLTFQRGRLPLLHFDPWVSELLNHVRLFVTPMDYTVHGILQARILEWVAVPFSKGSSQPRDLTQVSHISGEFFMV